MIEGRIFILVVLFVICLGLTLFTDFKNGSVWERAAGLFIAICSSSLLYIAMKALEVSEC